MAKPELLGEVKKLISMGKEKGFLTYDELNSTLPAEVVSSEQFGSIMTMFGEMDIEIVDAPEGERIRKARDTEESGEDAEDVEVEAGAGAGAGEENEKEEKEEKEIDLTPGALSRTDDPVRLYLKEMGSVALLSREGEIEIAKRIEEGKKDIASVIYGMPMTIEFVLALCDQLKNGTIDVREIVPIVETEEEFEEEQIQRDYEELRVKTLEGLNSVRKISTSLKSLYEVVRHADSDPAKQKKIKKQIDTIPHMPDRLHAPSVPVDGLCRARRRLRLHLIFLHSFHGPGARCFFLAGMALPICVPEVKKEEDPWEEHN